MDIRTPGFTRFSRFGANLGRIHATEARHTEGLDGTDTLEITCLEDLSKNDYIVWRDRRGVWHEHIVDTHTRTHDDTGAPMTVATCINSIAETWDDYVADKRPNGGAYSALSSILETTRWAAGPCTQEGIASHTFYHISAREALQELLETWGGELETVITCDGDRVTAREARIRSVRGNQNSAKRFTWSKDLVAIAREVASDNPKSRIYAYGKGEETDSGGYGRRIGIESVNGGKAYVEDAEATKLWGHPMGDGTIAPACGIYVNETCDDPATLLAEAKKALEAAKVPTITYVADVLDLVSFGRDWEDVALGDLVAIVDKGFSDSGIRLRGRVSKLERDLFTYDTTVTFGNLVDAIATPWQSLQSKVSSLSSRASNWDLAGTASPEWLETLMQELNAAYSQAGTYHYSSFEQGEIWSSVPLDENGRATRPGGWAMNINGLGFRLASSLNADGSWNWRTFGNGQGFTADEINAGSINADLIRSGTLSADRIRAGTITDGRGVCTWSLDSGAFTISTETVNLYPDPTLTARESWSIDIGSAVVRHYISMGDIPQPSAQPGQRPGGHGAVIVYAHNSTATSNETVSVEAGHTYRVAFTCSSPQYMDAVVASMAGIASTESYPVVDSTNEGGWWRAHADVTVGASGSASVRFAGSMPSPQQYAYVTDVCVYDLTSVAGAGILYTSSADVGADGGGVAVNGDGVYVQGGSGMRSHLGGSVLELGVGEDTAAVDLGSDKARLIYSSESRLTHNAKGTGSSYSLPKGVTLEDTSADGGAWLVAGPYQVGIDAQNDRMVIGVAGLYLYGLNASRSYAITDVMKALDWALAQAGSS